MTFPLSFIIFFLAHAAQAADIGTCPSVPPLSPLFSDLQALYKPALASIWQPECDLYPKKFLPTLKSGLSPYWAQELIGADLAKDELAILEKSGKALATPMIADIDRGFAGKFVADSVVPQVAEPTNLGAPNHGSQAVNLIGGKGQFGIAYRAKMLPVTYHPIDFIPGQGFPRAVDKVANSPAQIVNLEVHTLCVANGECPGFQREGITPESLDSANQKLKRKILVAAAGNPAAFGKGFKSNKILAPMIVVSSISEEGLVSKFVDESGAVTISAPSDSYLIAPSGKGEFVYGGSSGATPLVSGSLGNVISLIPNLSQDEAKKMLVKTAVPLPAMDFTKKNGAGMLNGYKLVRIAERLKKEWPRNRGKINDPKLYDFRSEALAQLALGRALLGKKNPSCQDLKKALGAIRKSFLLDSSSNASRLLAFLYTAAGVPRNAQFYSLRTRDDLHRALMQDDVNQQSALRLHSMVEILSTPEEYDDSLTRQRLRDEIRDAFPLLASQRKPQQAAPPFSGGGMITNTETNIMVNSGSIGIPGDGAFGSNTGIGMMSQAPMNPLMSNQAGYAPELFPIPEKISNIIDYERLTSFNK